MINATYFDEQTTRRHPVTLMIHKRVLAITGDPLPYGIAPNRQVIDALIGHALTQGIITKPVTAEELFAPGTHGLVA